MSLGLIREESTDNAYDISENAELNCNKSFNAVFNQLHFLSLGLIRGVNRP